MTRDPILRAYRPGDEIQIQELYRSSFKRDRPLAEWEWRYKSPPEGDARLLVVEDAGEIIGHFGHIGLRVFVDGTQVKVALGGDTMVRADRQGQGVMRRLTDGFLSSGHDYAARIGFPTDKSARLFDRYGMAGYIGSIDRWVRCETPRSMGRCADASVRRPLRPVVRQSHRAMKVCARMRRGATTVTQLTEMGVEIDELAARSASFAPCIRVRDSRYLQWRWFDQPGTDWYMLGAHDREGKLTGWAVYGIDSRRTANLKRGLVADLLVEDARSSRILLADAADRLAKMGSDVVILDLQDPRPWGDRAPLRAGFLRRGRGLNFLSKAFSSDLEPIVEDQSNWYLTLGDSDLA